MSAIRKKDYAALYTAIERSLAQKPIISGSTLHSAEEKMAFIDRLLDGVLITPKTADNAFTVFDRKALSPVRGKLMAFGIILGIFLLAMVFAGIVSGAASAVITPVFGTLRSVMEHFSVHPLLVSLVFFALTYGFGGTAENSILYHLGVIIEPVTMFFGLKWQAFLAFCASAISKESLLGVLNTLYGAGGSIVSSTFGAKAAGSSADISAILSANFTKPEGLAFIFTISFNMPCVSALAATARETHSVKWTAKIGAFYAAAALLVSCIVYHIGLLIF